MQTCTVNKTFKVKGALFKCVNLPISKFVYHELVSVHINAYTFGWLSTILAQSALCLVDRAIVRYIYTLCSYV